MDSSDTQNRRKIPAVSDVVAELSKRLLATPEQQPALFHAAQQVCAEELRLVRTGFRPAPFEELVDRALRLLPSEIGRGPFPEAEPFGTLEPENVPLTPGPFEAIESYEPPTPPAEHSPVQPLSLPESPAPPASPVVAAYRRPEAAEPRVERSARHSRSANLTRLLIFLGLVGVGYAAYRFSPWRTLTKRTRSAPRPAAAPPTRSAMPPNPSPASTSAPPPEPAPSTSAPPPATGKRPTTTPAPPVAKPKSLPVEDAAPTSAQEPPSIPESRGSSMISKDWDGHPAVFMIHFSSYQKKDNADRDFRRLSKLFDRPIRVIGVNLGREGFWYRVMLGDFSTRDEAMAYRQQVADTKAERVGLVYRVSGTR
jgi:hypothetical protein